MTSRLLEAKKNGCIHPLAYKEEKSGAGGLSQHQAKKTSPIITNNLN